MLPDYISFLRISNYKKITMKAAACFLVCGVTLALSAYTNDSDAEIAVKQASDIVTDAIPSSVFCGQGEMRFMMWNVYNAELYTAKDTPCGDLTYAHALKLTYKMNFSGADIASRSVKEMRGLKDDATTDEILLAAWHKEMRALFPDVKEGDAITGVYVPDEEMKFYLNHDLIGAISDKRFGKKFLAIWLSEYTSQPDLRATLLGL